MPVQTSQKEEEYFARVELEKRKKLEELRSKAHAEEERKRLRDLHFMRCPKCGMELKEIDYRGIQIDKCSSCNGIWLDAGEIEIISKLDRPGLDRIFNVFQR